MGIAQEFVDVETARKSGREGFGKMLAYLKKHRRTCCTILVEKTDRLYRNLTDWATIDELGIVIHFVKENVIISPDSRSADQFLHGIKVLMARNYSQNLGEENHKGHDRKSAGIYPSFAPIGYQNVDGPGGKRVITPDQDAPTVRLLFDLFATGGYSLKRWSKKHMPRASRCAVGASKPASFTCSSGSASIAGTLTGMATPTRELTNPS
jgi:DNA invertase Pin-like site-specific DNA recombinase